MNPAVLFCDNHILVIDKPPLMVTQTTQGHDLSLEEWAKAWIKEKFNKQGAVFLHALHRLDGEVRGIVLFARTSKALSRLNEAMRKEEIHKTYQAIVEGNFNETEGTLRHDLEHKEHRAVIGKSPNSKEAVLHFRVMKKQVATTLVEIDLETGRYHQIRAQFSAIGHPILGDKKYGSCQEHKEPGIALWHKKLVFPHPVLKEVMEISSHLHLG